MKWRHNLFNDRWAIEDVWRGMRGGFFIEAGAVNGLNGSATYVLEHDFGWNGICVEAIDHFYDAIPKFRNCKRDNRALYSESGLTLDFAQIEDQSGQSGLTAKLRKEARNMIASTPEKVTVTPKQTVTLSDLLREHDAPELIHYLCLDVEGAELEVLRVFDFSGPYKILSASIEGKRGAWIMKHFGYVPVVNPYSSADFEFYFLHPDIDRYRDAGA